MDVGTASIRVATGMHRLVELPSATTAKRALRGGVVVDGEAVVAILQPLLAQGRAFGIVKPRVLACAPSDVNHSERELLIDSIIRSGASSVIVIPEPIAAAVGGGIDVSSPYAQMVIDIGEGVTDFAVIRSSKICTTYAVRTGCAIMRREIVLAAERVGADAVSDEEADELLRRIGVTHAVSKCDYAAHRSAYALETVVEELIDTASSFLRDLPHNLGCEIIENGIWLSGGGALIPGIRERLEDRTGISVNIVDNPCKAVVEGARAILPVVTALNRW
jgi:rod shape-determining protein MreB